MLHRQSDNVRNVEAEEEGISRRESIVATVNGKVIKH